MADRDIEQTVDQAPLRPIMAHRFLDALAEAGIIRKDELVTRVVIDAQVGHILKLYVERAGDRRLLDVVPTLDGVEIMTAPAPPAVSTTRRSVKRDG